MPYFCEQTVSVIFKRSTHTHATVSSFRQTPKMLPERLKSTYDAYKADTRILVQWLDHASKRKEKSKAKATSKKSTYICQAHLNDGTLARRVNIRVLLEQAKAVVARHEGQLLVPESVMNAGRRAIALRKKCANWYKESPAKEKSTMARNKAHWVFIELLEQILSILSPISDHSTVEPRKDLHTDNQSNNENYFAPLSPMVEQSKEEIDPSEGSFTEPLSSDGDLPFPEAEYSLEVEPDSDYAEVDVMLAVFCLFEDLRRFQSFLNRVWTQYYHGECQLSTVSVLTNTVIDVVRREENRFNISFPKYQGFVATTELLIGTMDRRELVFCEFDPIFLRPYTILHYWLLDDPTKPGMMPIPHVEEPEGYNPTLDRSKMDSEERFFQDEMMLRELMQEFYLLGGVLRYPLPVMDELTTGVQQMLQTKKDPMIWLIFSAQILIDVNNLLQEDSSRGLHDLQTIGRQACERVQSKRRFVELLEITTGKQPQWAANFMIRSDHFLSAINTWVLEDALANAKKTIGEKYGFEYPPQGSYYLFRFHPLLCGILMFHIQLSLAVFGLDLLEDAGLTFVAYLYNVLRQDCQSQDAVRFNAPKREKNSQLKVPKTRKTRRPEKNSDERCGTKPEEQMLVWPDMDLVLNLFEERGLFMGEAPRGIADSLRRLYLVIGTPMKAFASDVRSLQPIHNPKHKRRVDELPYIVLILAEPYLNGNGLQDTTSKIEVHYHNLSLNSNRRSSPKAHDRTSRLSDGIWKHDRFRFIGELYEDLSDYQAWLRFDWLTFHTNCRTFMRSLKFGLLDFPIKTKYPIGHPNFEDWLLNYPLEILVAARDRELDMDRLRQEEKRGRVIVCEDINCENAIISRARKLSQEFIDKLGAKGREDWIANLGRSNEARAMIRRFSPVSVSGEVVLKSEEVAENVDLKHEEKKKDENERPAAGSVEPKKKKDKSEWSKTVAKAWLES